MLRIYNGVFDTYQISGSVQEGLLSDREVSSKRAINNSDVRHNNDVRSAVIDKIT